MNIFVDIERRRFDSVYSCISCFLNPYSDILLFLDRYPWHIRPFRAIFAAR